MSAAAAAAVLLQLTTVCLPREELAEVLRNSGEAPRSLGLSGKGTHIMELWVSDETGAYTVLRTDTDGTSCVLSSGDGFYESKMKEGEGL